MREMSFRHDEQAVENGGDRGVTANVFVAYESCAKMGLAKWSRRCTCREIAARANLILPQTATGLPARSCQNYPVEEQADDYGKNSIRRLLTGIE